MNRVGVRGRRVAPSVGRRGKESPPSSDGATRTKKEDARGKLVGEGRERSGERAHEHSCAAAIDRLTLFLFAQERRTMTKADVPTHKLPPINSSINRSPRL